MTWYPKIFPGRYLSQAEAAQVRDQAETYPVQRILITGGTGFVGPHLIRFLKSPEVKLFVVSSRTVDVQEPHVEYRKVDIRQADDVGALIRETLPAQIYHLAGVSTVAHSWKNPRNAFDVNVLGSYNIFEAAMRLLSAPRILNVSTAQVYARSNHALTETDQTAPDNPYAATKAMAELLAVQYKQSRSGGIITARAFNHTGPGQQTTFVMPSIAKQLAEVEAAIHPPVIKVGDLNVRRDFTDVRDVVAAYCALLAKGDAGETYNVCSGRAVLLADLVKELQKNCSVKVTIEIDPARVRPDEVPQMLGDPGKLQRATGWIPKIPIENTLKSLLDYWRVSVTRDPVEAHGARTRLPRA